MGSGLAGGAGAPESSGEMIGVFIPDGACRASGTAGQRGEHSETGEGPAAWSSFEDLLRHERRGHRRGPARIKGQVGDQFADLALADAVG